MHLRSITMKGFKSFPHRTRLDFSPGVGVVVGPNGSGKSNITDAVLWALGEQSPLAVRGQTMKDVIFAGGHGVKGSNAAEVEVVIDNQRGDGNADFSEISIVRRLDRSGEGEYRLNGARCRLADVVEVLSDTGLGKEMHSVVSQGRVEGIVLSRPRERRLLIEEAAGLGKHRRRRRRAQLKLERTGENLSRALDVEREARSRLRPLKRQAEAAQLHARLERQTDEARFELGRDAVRAARAQLEQAQSAATAARGERDEAERLLVAVAARREAAEEAFAALSREREALQARVFAARSGADRIAMRLERARDQRRAAVDRRERMEGELEAVESALAHAGDPATGTAERIAALEAELEALEGEREQRLRAALRELEADRDAARSGLTQLEESAARARQALSQAESDAEAARRGRREAERLAEAARSRAAQVGAELAAVNGFLRVSGRVGDGARALSDLLEVEPGYELALAAALGSRLGAAVVEDLPAAEVLLDGAGDDGGLALLRRGGGPRAGEDPPPAAGEGEDLPPAPRAELLLERVRAQHAASALAQRLLGRVWLVESLAEVREGFTGIAVTRAGRVLHSQAGLLGQAPAGGAERVLEQRNRRVALVSASEDAVRAEAQARTALEEAARRVASADALREVAETARRVATRDLEHATEALRRTEWLIERRREAPDEGPDAVRRAEVSADLRAERTLAETALRETAERQERARRLRRGIERDARLAGAAEGVVAALESALAAVAARVAALEAEGAQGAAAGEQTAAALRSCAHEEAGLQGRLRAASERVTAAEVAAQQVRDAAADADSELSRVAGRLGLEPGPAPQPLEEDLRAELVVRIERLVRRREQLGPVNPLAASEYEEAVAHVEELEAQRGDLESALAELHRLIRETDRRIRDSFEETFEAAASNFEEVVSHLFPGGRGRLRLVSPDQTPRPVLGGEAPAAAVEEADSREEDRAQPGTEEAGVEVEVTPAGKSTKRLSLLSGGEKSLVALAFMFAVFLARPCPFYILDEVEAALDDFNIDRFLELVRRYSDRAQFIVVTHQKRTMDAADRLYGVSMGGDGISRVVSRKLAAAPPPESAAGAA